MIQWQNNKSPKKEPCGTPLDSRGKMDTKSQRDRETSLSDIRGKPV